MNRVAPGSINTLRSIRLRLFALDVRPPPPAPKDPGAEGPTLVNQLLDALTLSLLKEAYVILLKTGDGAASLAPSAKSAVLARTGQKGELWWIEESALDGAVPSDMAQAYFVAPGQQYAFFWTRSKEIARAVWKDVAADPVAAMTAHPFARFEVAHHRCPSALPKIPLGSRNRAKLEILLHGSDGTWEGKPVHGTFAGMTMSHLGVQGVEMQGTYLLARSDALAALYLAELMSRHAVDTRLKVAEEFAVFDGVRDIIESAFSKKRIKELDLELSTIEYKGKRYQANEWNEEYYEYAYACASARVPRKKFWKAVDVMVTDDDWKEAANEIWRNHNIVHPSADQNGWSFKPCTKGVLQYFDFYDFGFRNAYAEWNVRSQVVARVLERRLVELRGRLGVFLARRAPYQRLMQELGAHCPEDPALRIKIHDWFLELSFVAKYHWWKDFAVESDQTWKHLQQYTNWIASGSDKLGELFGHHFGDPNEALKYNEALGESVEEFERLFQKLTDYDKRFSGKTVKRKYGPGLKIEADFERSVFKVTDPSGGTGEIGPVRFLVEVEKVDKSVKVQLPRKKSRAMRRRFKQVTRTTKVGKAFVPDVPFKKIQLWPIWMSAFGDSVALVITLKDLAEDWRTKDKLEVVGKLGMNTFQAIGSLSSAFYLTFKAGKSIPGLLKFAGGVGQVIEGYYNVKEGLIIIFDEDESDVVKALQRGDEIEAGAQMVKGWVLVSSVVPGAVGFGGGIAVAVAGGAGAGGAVAAGAAAAMTPLAIGLAVGALVVVGIEIFIYQHRGPDDAMEPIEDRLNKAVSEELGKAGEYQVSRTVDQLAAFAQEAGRVLAAAEA